MRDFIWGLPQMYALLLFTPGFSRVTEMCPNTRKP
jgi:hypothetical protein